MSSRRIENDDNNQPRSKLPINATSSPAAAADGFSSRIGTPIRLNSPHMSIADLAAAKNLGGGNISHHHLLAHLASSSQKMSSSESTSMSSGTLHNPKPRTSSQAPQLSQIDSDLESISSPLATFPSTPNSVDLEVMPTSTSHSNLPKLVHSWSHTHSILCCIASPKHDLLYCGTQDGKVLIFDMMTYSLKQVIERGGATHQINSVLTMTLNKDEDVLFVAGSDSLVKVYDVNGFVCTHIIYSLVDIGDIFSVAWCDKFQTLYIGAQNASILWCNLSYGDSTNLENLPHLRYDKFFDSKGPGGSQNTIQTRHDLFRKNSRSSTISLADVTQARKIKFIECKSEDIVRFAHHGYVYCLEIVDTVVGHFKECKYLISAGGDGLVNIWSMDSKLTKLASLQNDESVLSMTIQDSLLYVGLGDSYINVWDLMTLQLIRSFQFEDSGINEVLSLGVYGDSLFKACATSGLVKLTMKYRDVANSVIMSPIADHGVINTVKIFKLKQTTYLLAGGNKSLMLWDISDGSEVEELLHSSTPSSKCTRLTDNDLLSMLKKYISYKTISKNPSLYLEDSRHCAQFLAKLLNNFGAYQTKLLPVRDGNPIVFAEFKKNAAEAEAEAHAKANSKIERVLFYAHYDVVDATRNEAKDWSTNPFILTAKEGNLYARGVSDNKGPTLAAIYAVAELFSQGELSCDVVFIIEGEEECGSIGFQDVIHHHKALIGEIDWVMLSNSYWLDDITPCLNYGLRGVINANVTIKSDKPDRHSGVDGGVSREPVMDMMQLLSTLMDPVTQHIKIDGFYNDILPLTPSEESLYEKINQMSNTLIDIEVLKAKWRQPSLTIHKIQVSGPNNNTVIPQLVKATISIRIVPNQDLDSIKLKLVNHLHAAFDHLASENSLHVNIFYEAEPWLGDPKNKVYSILYRNIEKHWRQEPLFIREGGSIPSVRFLEKCFNAPAAQIPCGQSSDNAHLKDEKLRISNLFKLRSILKDTLQEIGQK
ncbi:uncharacterized protein LODBEIA_P27120 [Lodderomyces beijingensis]|uniref:Peptidase M20 dimerisation domain-containing protein n=1 Tax=Lodderomyces beijingensis TaxID=1775926 RepID=A0ABP0ZK10_9ASCO